MLNPRRADRHDLAARLLSSTVRMRGLSASQTPDFMHNLSEWLVRYGTWLMDATGIGRYENLQLIYNHLITFRDPQTLAPVSHWEHLFLQAQRAGFVASLRISVEVACCNCDKLLVLLKSGLVKGVTLVQEQARVPHGLQTGDVTNLVTQLQSYTALSFVGSYDFWRAVVLCDAVMDHRCFTISPISDRQARRRNCLGAVGCHVMEVQSMFVQDSRASSRPGLDLYICQATSIHFAENWSGSCPIGYGMAQRAALAFPRVSGQQVKCANYMLNY